MARPGQLPLRPLGPPGRPPEGTRPTRLTSRRGLGQHGLLSFPHHCVRRLHLATTVLDVRNYVFPARLRGALEAPRPFGSLMPL